MKKCNISNAFKYIYFFYEFPNVYEYSNKKVFHERKMEIMNYDS